MAYTSANEYLQALDQILKKNRGTRVNTLYDTASNVPDQLQTALPIPIKKKEDYTLQPDAIDQMQFDIPQARPFSQPTSNVSGATTRRSTSPYINYDTQGNQVALPDIPQDFEFQQPSDALRMLPKDKNGNILYGPTLPGSQPDASSLTPAQRRAYDRFVKSWNDGTYGTPEEMQYITANDPTGQRFGEYMLNQIKSEDPSMTAFKDGESLNTAEEYLDQARLAMQNGDYETGNMYAELANKLINFASESNTDVSANIPQENQRQVESQPQTQPQPNIFSNIANAIESTKPTGDYGVGLTEYMKGDVAGGQKELGKTIEKINPTGEFDLGITEGLQGSPQLAQEKRRQTAQNVGQRVADLGKSTGLPEMGFSESISNIFGKPAYAAEMGEVQEAPRKNIFSDALAQAGQGVSNIKNQLGSLMDENLFKKKDLATMGQKNVIGEDTSGAVASNLGDMKSEPSDSRNAFFKAGGLDTYKGELQSNVTSGYRGALNTNLFKDTFYQNPDNVANVFGNTSLGKDATGKYKSYMGTQYPIKPGGESPTIKKSEQYLGSYDGLTVDGEYWKDVFSRQGKDENSSEGKSFQDRERQNQQTYTWEDTNPIYYENQYNQSVLDSIPEVLKSAFSFLAPKTGKTTVAGGISSPQGLYQPVKGDTTDTDKYKDARSIPQVPVSNVFKPQGQMQSVPQVLGSSINKPTIPKPKPVPTPQYSAPPSSSRPSAPSGGQPAYSAPSKPQTSNYSAPKPTPAPTPSYSAPKPSYSAPAPAPKPSYSAPKPAPVPTPAPKPAPKPASNQSNVFQNLVNYLFGRR